MLVTSIFTYSHNGFKRPFTQGRQGSRLCGKGLYDSLKGYSAHNKCVYALLKSKLRSMYLNNRFLPIYSMYTHALLFFSFYLFTNPSSPLPPVFCPPLPLSYSPFLVQRPLYICLQILPTICIFLPWS